MTPIYKFPAGASSTNLTAQDLAQALGGEVIGRNRVKCPGPGHSPADRSLVVTVDSCAEEGFIVHSFANDDWRDCRDYVRDRIGFDRWHRRAVDRPRPAPTLGIDDATRKKKIAWARAIWNAAKSAKGTLVERYLVETRKLELPDTDAIRFHPRLKVTNTDNKFAPAMVCAMTSLDTGEFTGVHRTFLTPDGRKINKASLGSKGVIKIDSDDAVTSGLAIAEGVETTLAVRYLYRPAWCVVDAGGMERFPVLAGVEHLEIVADHDVSGTGLRAARMCLERWQDQRRSARIVMPNDVGADVADLVAG
jgi:putative DNA primase/helicase